MLEGLDPAAMRGIEIGPLTSPIVTRDDGEILYVDRADTAALRRKYQDHAGIDPAQIVEVDVVWDGNALQRAIGEARDIDYVLASHVIEHVPDLLGWLEEIRAVLRPGGELRLIVPDRRFTFDRLRQETRFSDLVYAHLLSARAPLPAMILDHLLEVAHVDAVSAWRGTIDDAALVRMHDLALARRVALDALQNGTYHDVHCWTFTPRSFADLMRRAAALGLIRFACTGLRETEVGDIEFFVGLRRCDVQADVVTSWEHVAEAMSNNAKPPVAPASLAASLAFISDRLDEATARLEMIDASITRDVMVPVRAAAAAVRRFAEEGSAMGFCRTENDG
jgi:SAM-dependent methyltransferase